MLFHLLMLHFHTQDGETLKLHKIFFFKKKVIFIKLAKPIIGLGMHLTTQIKYKKIFVGEGMIFFTRKLFQLSSCISIEGSMLSFLTFSFILDPFLTKIFYSKSIFRLIKDTMCISKLLVITR